MDLSSRQQQIVASILGGASNLRQLSATPKLQDITERTLQRDLNTLVEQGIIERRGEARAVSYKIAASGKTSIILPEGQLALIFSNENRPHLTYDFSRLDELRRLPIFSEAELNQLSDYNKIFQKKLETAPPDIIKRERERITIELSWKSSQFEGNTYTLLETETLLKEGIPATGKTQEETIMVLNHKKALDFAQAHPDLFAKDLKIQTIIELHRLLSEGLFSPGLRSKPVGITGSVYKPLDNIFKIKEELNNFLDALNHKRIIYEKALLAFTFICYLQPFNDGNKRTGRILANAILFANDSFPLSLRAIDVNSYKLALLAFYELGTLGNSKRVFIEQAKFAAENYAI